MAELASRAEHHVVSVLEGLNIRVGRFLSLPGIEAQLAPNNCMTPSLLHTIDPFTNTAIFGTLKVTK